MGFTARSALLAFAGFACVESSVDPDDVLDPGGKQEGEVDRPLGSWEGMDGPIHKLTLGEDFGYRRDVPCRECLCASLPCDTQESGFFDFTKSTTSDRVYIVFYDPEGYRRDRYEYLYDGKTLQLRSYPRSGAIGDWFALRRPEEDVQMCGGHLATGCTGPRFCDYTLEQMCGQGDQTGTCRPYPASCANELALPVCGCDDVTYASACFAHMAGKAVAHDGACAEECDDGACGPSLGMPNWTCPDGSLGGPTGRCIHNADGSCGWEIAQCP